jgi:cytochrome c oxidase subunit 1
MTTSALALSPSETSEPAVAAPDYLHAPGGVAGWLFTRDHKRIGLMFLVGTTLSLLVGGVFALLVRTELLTPERTIMSAEMYNRAFTLHGIVMVFMFMIPAIPSGFGNFLVPLMIGAKDVAFPRLNLASFYVYLAGSALTLASLAWGGADMGWTFYVPYSTTSPSAVVTVALGVFVLGLSSVMTGINFIATVHTLRAPGLSWHRLPLFVWSIYATSIIQVIATPVLGMALLLVGVDRAFGLSIFDPALGGDPLLFQHLFWFYSHPAVYIMVLPAMGVISEVVCTFAANPPASYHAIAYSSLGIALVGFFTWGHHLFVAGMSLFDVSAFGVLSMFVAVFSAIKVFTWTLTLYRGSVLVTTPLLYFFWFMFLFVFGGMTGVAVATSSLDIHWHDTYFVVAHFHFIMVGGTLTAWLAALHYWFPKLFGRRYSERFAMAGSVLVFGGFLLTFVPQFLLGNAGMPRRYYRYPAEYQTLNVISSVGAAVLAAGLLLTLLELALALAWGARSERNPWHARTLEWRAASPPPPHNWDHEVTVTSDPYDFEQPEA